MTSGIRLSRGQTLTRGTEAIGATATILVLVTAIAATAPATKPASRPSTKPATRPVAKAAPVPPPVAAPAGPELWEQIAQRKDLALRRATVERVLQMLSGNVPADQRAALRALSQTTEIRFDRTPFNPLVRQLLSSADDEVRAAALQALPNFGIGQEDMPLVAPLAEDRSPRVRVHVAAALVAANGRVGSPELDAAMLRLLDDADMNVRRESMRAINNIDVSEAVEAKLIALSHDAKIGREAINLGLSTRPVVRGEVAARLIDLLADPDQWNVVNRAAFALRNAAVEGEARTRLDSALLRTLEDSLNTSVRENCITALARSPDPEIWARLAQLAEDPNETDRIRETAARVLRQ